jgi:hypothetical protein
MIVVFGGKGEEVGRERTRTSITGGTTRGREGLITIHPVSESKI